jgi:cobalt-zinc-cadmium efflux system outer membrane protein
MMYPARVANCALRLGVIGAIVLIGTAAAQPPAPVSPRDSNPADAGAQGFSRAGDAPAGVLTVDDAVREAIDHNLTLVAERFSVSVADARAITARLRPNPVLTVSGMFPSAATLDNGLNPREQVVRTDVLLERGGKRERRIEVAEEAKTVAELQLLDTMRTLVLDVQSAAVEVMLARQNLALARESLDAFDAVVQVNVERVRTGDLAKVELARSRLAALQFQNEVRTQQAKLSIAESRLRTLLGRSGSEPITVDGALRADRGPVEIADIRRRARETRPDLRALRADQARTAADARLQIAQGRIDYTVSGELHRQYQPPLTDGHGYVYGVYLSVPLPIFNRNQGEIARANLEAQQAAARVTAREAEVDREVDAAYQTYLAAREVVSSIEGPMLEQARSVRSATEYSYRRGEASLVELLDAVRAFNETQRAYNEARADFARSLYALDSISGTAPAASTVTQ